MTDTESPGPMAQEILGVLVRHAEALARTPAFLRFQEKLIKRAVDDVSRTVAARVYPLLSYVFTIFIAITVVVGVWVFFSRKP